MPVSRLWTLAIASGLSAAAISSAGSWIASPWGDEAASLLSAERPVASLLRMARKVDAVHATYYLGLHYWIRLFGASPFSIRFPSALAIGGCVAIVVLIALRLGSVRLALIAGIVTMIFPRLTYDGEEARSYAFTALFAAALTLLLLHALEHSSKWLWVAYTAVAILAVYAFLYTGLVVLAHGIAVFMRPVPRSTRLRWALAAGITAAATAPIVVVGYLQRAQIAYLATTSQYSWQSTGVAMWFGTAWFAIPAWLLLAAGIACLTLPRLRATATRGLPAAWLAILAWAIVPALILIGSSPLIAGFTARYLAFVAPAIALLIALAIEELAARWRSAAAVLAVGLVVAAAPGWAAQRTPFAKNDSDWSQIAQVMSVHARPGQAVVFDQSARPSRRPRLAYRVFPSGFRGLRDVTLRVPFWNNSSWYDAVYTVHAAAAHGRFAGVHTVWMIEWSDGITPDTYGIADLHALGFREVEKLTTHRSEILKFVRH